MNKTDNNNKSNRTSVLLKGTYYFISLLCGVAIIVKIIQLQYFYEPDPYIYRQFAPQDRLEYEEAVRGDILTSDGEIMATSVPMFQVYMDCAILKKEFAGKPDEERKWREKAKLLAAGLAGIYTDKSADEYYRTIIRNRENNVREWKIGQPVTYETRSAVMALPLFREGRYVGGLKTRKVETRKYPYGSLARRVIGMSNDSCGVYGLEKRFDKELRGVRGSMYMKVIDEKQRVPNKDKNIVRAVDGYDVRTTLDLRLQEITDNALRKELSNIDNAEGGCAIVMEVKTGAIKAMVNLQKDRNGRLGETFNYASNMRANPGSVFKAVTLMSLLTDNLVNLEDSIPTFYGKWDWGKIDIPDDNYLYKDKWPDDKITVSDGLMISSNHVFRYLACMNYGDNPKRFTDRIKSYHLTDKFDFDLGVVKPIMNDPDDKDSWSGTSLPSLGMGYSVNITPLHILMFYNAIAGRGTMMKPYLVESIEKDGEVKQSFHPTVMEKHICSKAVADTLTRALLKVTEGEKGTARWPFKGSSCRVAGKTGTARVEFQDSLTKVMKIQDSRGRRKHQASFVGFFPAEEPEYTAIAMIFSKPMLGNVYGVRCAPIVRAIADDFYCISPQWKEDLGKEESMPKMKVQKVITAFDGKTPDLSGLCLADALYKCEAMGFTCVVEGAGHVCSQVPSAGTPIKKGDRIKMVMK